VYFDSNDYVMLFSEMMMMCVHFTLGRLEANSVVVTICIVGVSLAGCVHSPLKREQATREREGELRLVTSF